MPTEEELANTGLTLEDYADDFVECWPENWRAFTTFAPISTQWRAGSAGPFALDYGVLLQRLDRMKLADAEYEALFDDVRVLEAAALSVIHRRKTT
jgi:hypothetical protein